MAFIHWRKSAFACFLSFLLLYASVGFAELPKATKPSDEVSAGSSILAIPEKEHHKPVTQSPPTPNSCQCPTTSTPSGTPPIVTDFKWQSYRDISALKSFASEHFPVGTHRDYIESVLVTQGKASWHQTANHPAPKLTKVRYSYRFGGIGDCSSGLVFVYDDRDTTVYQAFAGNWTVTYKPFNVIGGCDGP